MNVQVKKDGGVAIGANCINTGVYGTAVGYSARTSNYSTAIGSSALAGAYGISIGTNCINSSDYATAIRYNAKATTYSTSIGYSGRTTGAPATCIGYNEKVTGTGIAIGVYCDSTTENYIKFWTGSSSTSTLAAVQFGNIILAVSGSNLTIKNATSFNVRPTLASGLSEPVNNNDNDIVTKEYVDS
jgi:hypothetical protein